MFKKNFISLSAYGHVEDIGYEKDGEIYLTLRLINQLDDSQSDEVWIECQVNMCDFPQVIELEKYFFREKSITLKFDAQYLGFIQSYHGMADNDPNSIVRLRVKLLEICEYYIESNSATFNNIHNTNNDLTQQNLRA